MRVDVVDHVPMIAAPVVANAAGKSGGASSSKDGNAQGAVVCSGQQPVLSTGAGCEPVPPVPTTAATGADRELKPPAPPDTPLMLVTS